MFKKDDGAIGGSGFTLIEILLVVAIISILLVVVFAALNPAQRLSDTRDARRWNDVNSLLTALHTCVVDNKTATALTTCAGTYAAGETYEIVDGAVATGCDDTCTGVTDDDNCLNWGTSLASYLASIPRDPSITTARQTAGHSEYTVSIDTNGLATITACNGEAAGVTIEVSR